VASHLDDVLTGWEPDVTKVFFGTDDFVAAASLAGTSQRALESDERRQLQVAQIVIAISESLAHRWRRLGFAGPLFTIPNGVCAEHYAANSGAAAPPVGLPRPIAGFVGHLSSRIDIGLLESVVDAGCSLLLIGPLDPRWEPARFRRLLENSRVLWKGPIDFDRLPGFLQTMDVGLTPYTDSAFNQSSFPLKTLEYLATGKPALSTDLPSVRWLNTDLITIAKPEDFGRVALEISRMDGTDIAGKRKAFAMNHSWSRRAMSFADAIGIRMPQGRASAAD
jgi:teichuronic acid biosynthesis glycosyltransferase TuaH